MATASATTGTVVAIVIATVGWGFAMSRFKRLWNATPLDAKLPEANLVQPQGIKLPPRLFQGIQRQAPTATLAGGCFVALAWLGVFAGGSKSPWAVASISILALVVLTGFALMVSVWLVNKPQFLVPPALRGAPGILTSRKGQGIH